MATTDGSDRFRKGFVLVAALAISALFFSMIRDFVVPLLLAGIFSALAQPLYRILLRRLNGRQATASALTIVLLIVVVVGPLTVLIGMVTGQALEVSQAAKPWIDKLEAQIHEPGIVDRLAEKIPFIENIRPYQSQILEKAGELAGAAGSFLFKQLSGTAKGTVAFFLNFFILVYSMFFFIRDGKGLVDKLMDYLPLSNRDAARMLDRFVSVSRATLKGTVVIGIVQGALAGAGFWAAGIQGSLFWATIMAVLSVVPGVGAALIWVPGVAYLLFTGKLVAGLVLAAWCALVVGTVDNLLRPRLVGSDTQMPDVLILISTLGGIFAFGFIGFIIGPIIAALFMTIWDIYGTTFADILTHPEDLPPPADETPEPLPPDEPPAASADLNPS
jgi:predicted PurR-regulated permease PerM